LATLRGVDMKDIQLNFTHANVDFAGCDSLQGGDCSKMGIPNLENDIIQFRLSLDLDVHVNAFYLTYGIADRVDFGAVIPIVQTSLIGSSEAQVRPFGGPTAAHFFAGTPANPVLTADRPTTGSGAATGGGRVPREVGVADW